MRNLACSNFCWIFSGQEEAIQAGERLLHHEKAMGFDVAFASVLQRSITTLRIILEVTDKTSIPQVRNE